MTTDDATAAFIEDAFIVLTQGIRKGDVEPEQIEKLLSVTVNGARSETVAAFSLAIANDHPTLSASIAKAVALGIVRRARYDPEWRPFDPLWNNDGEPVCTEPMASRPMSEFGGATLPKHKVHDGRLDCTTVIGSALVARQSYT